MLGALGGISHSRRVNGDFVEVCFWRDVWKGRMKAVGKSDDK